MHCYRIPKEFWRDRLKKAKAMGLNAISTYVFWNVHEPEKGIFNFSDNADIAEFVKEAAQEGLWVVLRPSPYCCAEWEFGGYPYWILKDKEIKVRTKDPKFMSAYKNYVMQLAKQLAPLQITNGGPILLLQIENEYGSFSNDKEYLNQNKNIFNEAGFNVNLFTCDGYDQIEKGYIPGVYAAVNGQESTKLVKEVQDKFNKEKGPYFVSEWYPGWFDKWGDPHSSSSAIDNAEKLDAFLENDISVNLYMFHGGTTRDFMNGAHCDVGFPFNSMVTSYDYDAPLDEAGNPTEKYFKFREVILKHLPKNVTIPDVPQKKKNITIANITLNNFSSIYENLKQPITSENPLSFEEINQAYGYILYRVKLSGDLKGMLKFSYLRDYAVLMNNHKIIGVLDRRLKQDAAYIELSKDSTLDILVENCGRVNYGTMIGDNKKGIFDEVQLNGKKITGWKMYGLPFTNRKEINFKNTPIDDNLPTIKRGHFSLSEIGDTYFDMRSFGKGFVVLNGHNLGRYWNIGPTQTMYVPSCWLNKGDNEVIVFEIINSSTTKMRAIENPILNEIKKQGVSINKSYDTLRGCLLAELIAEEKNAQIYYTLDGSEPTTHSFLYDKKISISQPTTLSAKMFRENASSGNSIQLFFNPSFSTEKELTLKNSFSDKYNAGGKNALIDGLCGSTNFKDGAWQGFQKNDLEAIIDLGEIKNINLIQTSFIQDIDVWIFLPTNGEISISTDGKNYTSISTFDFNDKLKTKGSFTENVVATPKNLKVRYIKVFAKNVGLCPAWHVGANDKAWLFCDEIIVK